jgi:Glycosyltransferase family 87
VRVITTDAGRAQSVEAEPVEAEPVEAEKADTSARATVLRGWLLLAVAAAVTAMTLAGLKEKAVGFDLVQVYVPAAERVLDGVTPYPATDDPVFAGHQAYVYPPLTALLAVPLTWVPEGALPYLAVLGALAVMLLALAVVGVRDPAVYAVFMLWPTTLTAWQNANVTVLMMLSLALTWRFRDSWAKAGAALGLGIALKLLLWPLSIWALATGRARAAVASVAVAVVALLGSWLAIGFHGLGSYLELLSKLTDVEGENSHGVSLYSDAIALGLPKSLATAGALAIGGAVLATAIVLARRGEEKRSFLLAVVAALALTPLVWLHYLTLLAIPLAAFRPRLSGLWAVPLLFWVIAVPGWPTEPRRLVALVVVGALVWLLAIRPRDGASARSPLDVRRTPAAAETGR